MSFKVEGRRVTEKGQLALSMILKFISESLAINMTSSVFRILFFSLYTLSLADTSYS